jgi:hypothetical protein
VPSDLGDINIRSLFAAIFQVDSKRRITAEKVSIRELNFLDFATPVDV